MPRASGRRNTVQKALILSALDEVPGFISAQDLHQLLEERGDHVGLATVYRHLNALVAAGEADAVPVANGRLFRACSDDSHHHHLVCEECGRAEEVEPPDESWLRQAAGRHGYTIDRHVLEIFGRCGDCASPELR